MKIEPPGLLDKIAGARAAVADGVTRANVLLRGSLGLVLEKDVLSCDWKSKDTLAAVLSEAAGVFHCWQGRNRMAIDAIGLDVERKLGEALVVSRDDSGNVVQKLAAGSAQTLVSKAKPFTINDAANPDAGEALAILRNGKLVRLVAVLYKDPVANIIAVLQTNEVPADALTCRPTFGWYSLLLPRYDLKTFHRTYCQGQPDCTTVVLAPAAPGAYPVDKPEFKCFTCGKSTRMPASAKTSAKAAPPVAAPAAPAPAKPDPDDVAAEQTKDEVVHNLEGKDFTGAYTRLDVQSMPQMLRILGLLGAAQIEALVANLNTPHGRYTERLRAALTAVAAADGRMAVTTDRFAADVASLKNGDPQEQQKGELLAYLRENDDGEGGAVGMLIRRLQSKIMQSPEVDGRMIVVEAGDPVSAHARVRYRVVATNGTLGEEIVKWRWIDRKRETGKIRWAGTPVGPEVENDRIRDDGSWEKSWPEDGVYAVICVITPKRLPSGSGPVPPLTTLMLVQTVLPVDASGSPLAVAFEANRKPPSYAEWKESLAPSAPPPPLKSRIECSGANPALVSSATENTYTIVPRDDVMELTWYLRGSIPEHLGATYNEVYWRETTDDGDEVITLPTSDDGRRATWVLSFPGRFDIVCEQRLADGRVLACVYTQVVEQKDTVDERARQAREVREHLAAAHTAVMKLKYATVPDPDYPVGYIRYVHAAVPVRANYLDYRAGKVVALPMFIGPAKSGGILLLDLSLGADVMEYEGDDVAAAVEAFRSKNTYPTGRVRLTVPPNDWVASHDRAFDTGGRWTRAKIAGYLGDASFALGVLAMWIPGGQVLGLAILATSVPGAAAGALNVYNELQKREPDYARVAVDVVGIAGAIVGAASGIHGLIKGDAYAISDRAGKFYHLSGLASAIPGAVLLHVDFVVQFDKALEKKDPQERREAVQELLVDLLLQEAMLAVQVRDLHNNAKRHTHAGVEVHDHAMGVAGTDYFIEKVGKGNPRTLLKHIEQRFEMDAKLREQNARPTYEVVKETRTELNAMERRGASAAEQTAYVMEQLEKILGASDETPFNHAYEIRDELIKEWIDKKVGLLGQRYAHYIADVMRMLAREGIVYSEQSVSVKKLATTMPESDFVKARKKLRETTGGKLDLDMRLLAMMTTSGISEPTLPAPEETAAQPAAAEARQQQIAQQMGARQAGFDEQFELLGQVILRGDVIGVDIAGPETDRFNGAQGMKNLRRLYDLLKAVAGTRNRAMVLRPHVGEGYSVAGEPEGTHVATAQHNVTTLLDALERMGYSKAKALADGVVIRFGHATHATPEQIKRMGEMGIYAEANIGSNVATGSIPGIGAHPLLYNLYFETPTILSTDGGGVMHTTLEREYTEAARKIEEFKTNSSQKIKVDGKERGWVDLSAEEKSRFDVERLKKWAKGYRRSVLEDDLWTRDSRGVVHEF